MRQPWIKTAICGISFSVTGASAFASPISYFTGCTALPASGATAVLEAPTAGQNIGKGVLNAKNDRSDTVVLLLTDPAGKHNLQALVLGPGSGARVSVPVRSYGLSILHGEHWCNLDVGFKGGMRTIVEGGVEITPGDSLLTTIGTANDPSMIRVTHTRYQQSPQDHQPSIQYSAGEIEVRPSDRGYVTAGTINRVPVSFMVDTGASQVMISSAVANKVGILTCDTPTRHMTANGVVSGCQTLVPELTVGPFLLSNVRVNILPNLTTDALLGMDVLSNFSMIWRGGILRISMSGSEARAGQNATPDGFDMAPAVVLNEWPTKPTLGVLSSDDYFYIVAILACLAYALRRKIMRLSPARKQGVDAKPRGSSNSVNDAYYYPKQFRTGTPSVDRKERGHDPKNDPSLVEKSLKEKLITACGGERIVAERLIRYEIKLNPKLSLLQATRAALERLARDRK